MRKQIRMITYLPYYHLDAAFDNGLRKDYGNSEIRYDHFYYKEKKLSFTRQEFCNAHQLGRANLSGSAWQWKKLQETL